jgi:HPr kinase/phosphorylase
VEVEGPQLVHATCVAVDGRGLLLMGRAGSGKSALALALMALGARLVADDQTRLTPDGAALVASCPPTLRGLIEARGLGILHAEPVESAPVVLVVDLDHTEDQRLPPVRHVILAGRTLALVHAQQTPHFPAALLQYVRGGRHA